MLYSRFIFIDALMCRSAVPHVYSFSHQYNQYMVGMHCGHNTSTHVRCDINMHIIGWYLWKWEFSLHSVETVEGSRELLVWSTDGLGSFAWFFSYKRVLENECHFIKSREEAISFKTDESKQALHGHKIFDTSEWIHFLRINCIILQTH